MKCLVIIPAYNEEENIVRVVENLQNELSHVRLCGDQRRLLRRHGPALQEKEAMSWWICP